MMAKKRLAYAILRALLKEILKFKLLSKSVVIMNNQVKLKSFSVFAVRKSSKKRLEKRFVL